MKNIDIDLIKFAEFVKNSPDGEFLILGKNLIHLKNYIVPDLIQIVGTKDIQLINQGKIKLFGKTVFLIDIYTNDGRELRGMEVSGVYSAAHYSNDFYLNCLYRIRQDEIKERFFGFKPSLIMEKFIEDSISSQVRNVI